MKRWVVIALIMLITGCAAMGEPANIVSVTSVANDMLVATSTPLPAHAWVVSLREEVIRSGPGRNYNFVGALPARVPNEIGAISEDGKWVLLLPVEIKEFDGGFPASKWVELSPYVKVEGDVSQLLLWKMTMTPTLTPSPTPSYSPSAPMVAARRDLVLRAGPGEQYAEIGTAIANMTLSVYAVSGDGLWVLVSPIGDTEQWLGLSPMVTILGDLYSAEIYQSYPTSTPALGAPTVKILAAVSVRYAPLEAASYVVILETGEEVALVARSRDGAWYGLQLPNMVGWIPASSSVQVVSDLTNVPVFVPTSTPSPTATVTSTPIPTVDVDAIAATVEAAVIGTLSAQGTMSVP